MAFANAPKSGYTQEDLAQLGPSDVDRMRKMAEALIASGMGGETISDPWQGIAQLVRGLNGQIGNWQAYRAEQKGKQGASDDFGEATVGFPAAPGGSGSAESAGGGGDYRSGIAGIESGGRYDAMGPTTKSGDRAYGKYQMMGANIGPWTQQVLGTAMSPQDFIKNPKAQDKVFDAIFGGYVQKYGPEGAAQAWFGGPGSIGKTERKDQLGTSVGDYGKRFVASLGGGGGVPAVTQATPVDPTQVASLDPSVGMPQPQAAPAPQQVQVAQALIGGGQDPAQTLGAPALNPAQIMTGQQAAQRNAMGNEWLNPGQRRLIESLVGQQIQSADPEHQLDMDYKRAQLNKLQNPTITPYEQAQLDEQARDNARQEQALELQGKTAAAAQSNAALDNISGVRKEVQGLPSYKNIAQAAPVYRSMVETASRDTKASDLNLVYGLAKLMDPGSVVREGEVHMANDTQGLADYLNGVIKGIQGEGRLTPEGRQALMTEAYSRMNAFKQAFDTDVGMYRGIVDRNKWNPADVLPDLGAFEPWQPAQTTAPAAGAAPAVGTVMDGYRFKGGDPADQNNWEPAN